MPDDDIGKEPSSPSPVPATAFDFDETISDNAGNSEFSCSRCAKPLVDQYYQANGAPLCSECRWEAEGERQSPRQGGARRLGKALVYGAGAAAVGTLIYFLVSWTTGYEVGLIAILVGWLVGKSVFLGSGEVGGRPYQFLAIGLTYLAICASYVPMIVAEMSTGSETEISESVATEEATDAYVRIPLEDAEDSQPVTQQEMDTALPFPSNEEQIEPGAVYKLDTSDEGPMTGLGFAVLVVIILLISLAAPFLAGFENILGLLIIGFGLFEAWKHAGRAVITFDGPFAVGGGEPAESNGE